MRKNGDFNIKPRAKSPILYNFIIQFKNTKTLFMKKIMMLAVAALLTTGAVFACDGKKDCTKCKFL